MKLLSKTMNNSNKKIFAILIGLILLIIFGIVAKEVLKNGIGPGVQDYSSVLNADCELHRNSVHEIFIRCHGIENRIEPKVVSVGWSDDYVIAKTNPVSKRKYPNNPNNTYKIPDTDIVHWWVFDLNQKILIGPLDSEQEFNNELNEKEIYGIEMVDAKQLKN